MSNADKLVIVNPKRDIYHEIGSPNGNKLVIPNKDGSTGKVMPEREAKKVSRKSKK